MSMTHGPTSGMNLEKCLKLRMELKSQTLGRDESLTLGKMVDITHQGLNSDLYSTTLVMTP